MISNSVLAPQRAEAVRHLLLIVAALSGFAISGYVLSSQTTADFLREGPVRFTGLEGDTLRLVLGLGALGATVITVGAIWQRVDAVRLLIAGIALGSGLFLVHVLLMPVAILATLACGADLSVHVPRERLQKALRYPAVWVAGLLATGGAVAGIVLVSIWLLGPLFDEGTTLNEMLDFEAVGLMQPEEATPTDTGAAEAGAVSDADSAPADAAAAAAGTVGDGESTPPDTAPADADTAGSGDSPPADPVAPDNAEPASADAPPARTGTLIANGELMGVDSFHTGSGDVLLVSDPDGNVILRFQDYAVRNGPDLFIYLTPDPDGDVHADGAVDLGEIRATQGFVNYEVPADVDPTTFRAAVIYCRAFSVTFAVAQLN